MDRVRKPNISESYTPSPESYSNYLFPNSLSAIIKDVFDDDDSDDDEDDDTTFGSLSNACSG
jgi:hypothetical protein